MLDEVVATEADLRKALFTVPPAVHCLVAEADGRAVGFALYFFNFSTFTGRPGLYLEDVYVQPASRGRGIGKALLKELAGVAVERGCRRFEWVALDWNKPAIDFYTSIGAKAMEEWKVFLLDGAALKKFADG